MPETNPLRAYAAVTAAYWAFMLTDGALRMLVLLHFHRLGYTPFTLAFLFLLYEFAAADAWPLNGMSDLDEFDGRLIAGERTIEPRLERVPVRMPLPPALNAGSIYENQKAMKSKVMAREPAPAM